MLQEKLIVRLAQFRIGSPHPLQTAQRMGHPAANMRKQIIVAIVSIVIVALMGRAVFLAAENHQQKQMAYECLQKIESLSLGVSTFSDAQELARRYSGLPWSASAQQAECSIQDCNLRFVFQNNWIGLFRTGKKVSLVAALWVKNGYVASKEVDYSVMSKSEYSQFFYFLLDQRTVIGAKGYEVRKAQLDERNVPHVLKVTLSPEAPPEVRAKAYTLDLTCLSRLYGCNDGLSIFPSGL